MATSLIALVSSLIISLCLVIALRFLYKVVWIPIRVQYVMRSQGIKGPPYKYIYGNVKEVIQMRIESSSRSMDISHDILSKVQPHYYAWIKLYGANFVHWIGPKPQMVVTDPVLIREIMSNKEGCFAKVKIDGDAKRLLGDGLAMTESDKWSKLRKIATQAFHAESLKEMAPAMIASVEGMLEKWKKQEGKEIEVSGDFRVLTSEVISRTAFGSSYLDGKNIFEMLMKLSASIVRDVNRPKLFGIQKLLRLHEDIESNKYERSLYESIVKLVRGREAMLSETGEPQSLGSDFLGSLLRAHHNIDKDNNTISLQDIIDECKTFYFAGHETTNSLFGWVIFLLAIHTDWQEKARKEVIEICGRDVNPTPETVQRLKTMSMIIHETSRLYAPVLTILRTTKRKTKIGKLTIPAGVEVDIPILAVHHNPKIWGEDAHLFKPERFAQGVANATSTMNEDKSNNISDKSNNNNVMSYFAFGNGPRKCVGLNFTTLEVKIALSMILQRYSFTLSPNYVHSPSMILTLQPQHGVKIILRPIHHE